MRNENSEFASDCILYNARVITLDPAQPFAEFVAIKGNKIMGVGRRDELDRFKGTDTKLIDCEGGAVIPGFNDAHCHPLSFAATLVYVDCSKEAVKDIDDIKERIHNRAKQTPGGKWIRAANYDELGLSEKRAPNRWELDEAAPANPVILVHRYGQDCVLNSMALQIAGIDNKTEAPSSGTIHRDTETKRPNGLISGRNEQVERAIPPLDDNELEEGVKLANNAYLSFGITSLQDTSWTNGLYHWQRLKGLIDRGSLCPRLTMLVGTESFEDFHKQGLITGSGNSLLRLGGVKIALDESTGCIHPLQEDINNVALMAKKAGFQLAFHVSDVYMLQASLKAIESVLLEIPRYDHRHRLEHCAICPPGLLPHIKKSNAIIIGQPSFLYYTGQRYLDEVPPSQLNWVFPIGSYNENGIKIAFGSDSPVVPSNPLIGIYAAVTRKVESGQLFCRDEGVSVLDAIKMYTIWGAYVSFEEEVKGSISNGKLADLVVLSDDPTQISPEELMDLKVMRTIIDGQVMWDRDNAG
jgi:predicted amidohydrolase YtcJ